MTSVGPGHDPLHGLPPDRGRDGQTGKPHLQRPENTRGGFGTLWTAASGFESHCDIVAGVDRTPTGLETRSTGGNVQDTFLKTTYRGSGASTLGNVRVGKR